MFLSGHLRDWKKSKNFINSFNGDVFLSTWDYIDCESQEKINIKEITDNLNITDLEVCPYKTMKESFVKKYDYFKAYKSFQTSFHKNRQGYDSFCMFYIMKRAWLLLKKREDKFGRYKSIVRFRPDYIFQGLDENLEFKNKEVYFPENSNYH